ncbi:MAG: hypothetical protein JXA21_17630 [Anaerolineae bacterium]|nr:hypothetical protein [Anaerolineae bacterium]
MHKGLWQRESVWAILAILLTTCAVPEKPLSPKDTATPLPFPTLTPTRKPPPTLTPTLKELQPEWTIFEPAREILAKTDVEAIAIAPDGSVWLGTDDGPYRFDGKSWTSFMQGLSSIYANALAIGPAGGIWVGTGDGIARFTGDSWQKLEERYGRHKGEFTDIAVAPDGALWFARPLSIARFDGKDEWNFHYDPLKQEAQEHILALAITEDGDFWFGTRVGAFHLDAQSKALTPYTTDDGLVDNDVEAITAAPDGALWFATHRGASRFDGETWAAYTPQDGLVGQVVLDIAMEPDGALWFLTSSAVCRYQPQSAALVQLTPTKVFTPIPTYTPRPTRTPRPTQAATPTPTPLPAPFRTVSPVADILPGDSAYLYRACDGTPWLVSDEAVAMLEGDTWRLYLTGITGTVAGIDASGHVWVAGEDCSTINAWDGATWITYGPEDGWSPISDTWGSFVRGGRCDLDGNFWTTTSQDVRVFEGTRWAVFTPEAMGMNAPFSDEFEVYIQLTVQQSTGAIWVGVCEGTTTGPSGGPGARRFDGASWHGADSPAASGCVAAIEEDAEGNVWLGVDGVLWRYAPSGTWHAFAPPETFPDGYRRHGSIPLLAADSFERLWVSTLLCGGASCDTYSLYYLRDGAWTDLTRESGFYAGQLRPFTDKAGASWLFADNVYRLNETGIEPAISLRPDSVVVDTGGKAWFILRDYPQDMLVTLD